MADIDRTQLEAAARRLRDAEWIGATIDSCTGDILPPTGDMGELMHAGIQARSAILAALRAHPAQPVNASTLGSYWAGYCPTCAWRGSSEHADGGEPTMAGDFSEVICPICGTELEETKTA